MPIRLFNSSPISLAIATFLLTSCGSINDSSTKEPAADKQTTETPKSMSDMQSKSECNPSQKLVEVLKADQRFTTLVAAIEAAGLTETLSGTSAFTVFAPTNEAFAALPEGTLENLLKPESKETLKSILLYHVVEGRLKAEQVLAAASIKTVNGLSVSVDAKKVKINMASILSTDSLAENGVIHAIGSVLLPPAKDTHEQTAPAKTIAETVASESNFSTLLAALNAADLASVLNGSTVYTVFAPTNEAFAALPAGTLDFLLRPENKAQLVNILLFHVVPGKFPAASVLASQNLTSALQKPLAIDAQSVTIAGAKISKTDILASNGIVHVIDSVLIPPAE
jgi:transforming growth factor-beta-induced protein